MKFEIKKKVIKPLCIYSLAFSMLLPSVASLADLDINLGGYSVVHAQEEVKKPTIKPVSIGDTKVTGGGLIGAGQRKAKRVGCKIIVTVKNSDNIIETKEFNLAKDGKAKTWSVTLDNPVQEGYKVYAKQEFNGGTSEEAFVEVKQLLSKLYEGKLTMPKLEVWSEDLHVIEADAVEDIVNAFKAENNKLDKVDEKNFEENLYVPKKDNDKTKAIDVAGDGKSLTVTFSDGSKIENIPTNVTVTEITENSMPAEVEKLTVVDGEIKGKISGKGPFNRARVTIVKFNNETSKKNYCESGKCTVDKNAKELATIFVDEATGEFSYKVTDNKLLTLGKDIGITVKEYKKKNNCKTIQPSLVIPKVDVRDPKKLTDTEKETIRKKIREANTVNGVSKLPDGTGFVHDSAFIEFDKDGNVTIISPNDVESNDWDSDGNPIYEKNPDGSYKLQDGKTPAKTVEPKEVLNNLPPKAPKVELSKDNKNITVTPDKADTDVKEVSVTYKGTDGSDKKTVAKKGKNGWEITEGEGTVDSNGVITLPTKNVKGGETVNATVKDDGFAEAKQDAEESKNGALTVPEVKTKAKQIEELGGLDPVVMKKWVGDELNWKEGVKAKDSAKETEVNNLLNGATFTDATDTARTTKTAGKHEGKIKVKFDDGSEIVVENQKLYVSDHVTWFSKKETPGGNVVLNENTPDDALVVEFKLGEGTKVDNTASGAIEGNKNDPTLYSKYKVKPNTNLKDYKLPVVNSSVVDSITLKAQEGYVDPAWNTKDFVATDSNKVFTATATETFKVTVKPNGGTGDEKVETIKKNETYTLPAANTFTPPNENQEFSGWQIGDDSKNLKNPGENITITKDVEVKAIWKPVEYKVSFKSEGGATGSMTDEPVIKGSEYVLPTPTFIPQENYEFVGWRVGNGTNLKKVGEKIKISGSVELTAVYSPIAKIEAPKVSVDTNTGNLIITPPTPPAGQKIKSVTVNYQDPSGAEKTVTVEKSSDRWDLVPGATNGETRDSSSGVITIPRGHYKLGEAVKAYANNQVNQKSEVANKTPVEISFDMMNGGKKGVDSLIKIKDQFYVLPAIHELPEYQLIIPDGKEFDGWEIDGVRKAVGESVKIDKNTLVKALWRDKGTSPSLPEVQIPEENEIPGIKIRDHYTPTFPVYVTVPKTEKVEKAEEVPVSLETHKAYIAGYEDNTLRAEGNLTRAEAAAMVTRLAGLDLSDTSMPAFKDMQKNAWYFRYINAAVKAKMLDADNGMMRPNDKITRAEFAKMLAAIDKENSSVSKFDDIKGHRYEKEINKIYGNNRIEGYEDGSFRPDAYLTRAESAAFLNRMFNRIADKEAYAGLEDKLAKFKDFDASKWYYDEMVEATNSHELTRRGKASDKFGRVYEKWTRILPSDVK
ncbi:S-layer homology domain-containing protein, partial [Peptoniphilus genitalis]